MFCCQDPSLLNASFPSFTPCFQDTVLVWVPSAFLIVFSIYHFLYLRSSSKTPIKWSKLHISKVVSGPWYSEMIFSFLSYCRVMPITGWFVFTDYNILASGVGDGPVILQSLPDWPKCNYLYNLFVCDTFNHRICSGKVKKTCLSFAVLTSHKWLMHLDIFHGCKHHR